MFSDIEELSEYAFLEEIILFRVQFGVIKLHESVRQAQFVVLLFTPNDTRDHAVTKELKNRRVHCRVM